MNSSTEISQLDLTYQELGNIGYFQINNSNFELQL